MFLSPDSLSKRAFTAATTLMDGCGLGNGLKQHAEYSYFTGFMKQNRTYHKNKSERRRTRKKGESGGAQELAHWLFSIIIVIF